jgi:hypothetical protein
MTILAVIKINDEDVSEDPDKQLAVALDAFKEEDRVMFISPKSGVAPEAFAAGADMGTWPADEGEPRCACCGNTLDMCLRKEA